MRRRPHPTSAAAASNGGGDPLRITEIDTPASTQLVSPEAADRVETRYRRVCAATTLEQRRYTVGTLETYLISLPLLLVAAGLAMKQLGWKAKPVLMRRRGRGS
jgi:hypothetical protein